jgi:hypothetical protein
MVIVLLALVRNLRAKRDVESIMGKRERQWAGACDTSAQAARFDVDFIIFRTHVRYQHIHCIRPVNLR